MTMQFLIWFIVFWSAFIIGLALMISGASIKELADCPALLSQFPPVELRCSISVWFVFGGGLAMLVGAGAGSGMLVFRSETN